MRRLPWTVRRPAGGRGLLLRGALKGHEGSERPPSIIKGCASDFRAAAPGQDAHQTDCILSRGKSGHVSWGRVGKACTDAAALGHPCELSGVEFVDACMLRPYCFRIREQGGTAADSKVAQRICPGYRQRARADVRVEW